MRSLLRRGVSRPAETGGDRVGPIPQDGPIPVHPETVDHDPASLRWVVPPGVVTARGRVFTAPGDLGALLASGDVASVVAAADAVTIRLAEGRTWPGLGGRVRAALGRALRDPDAWVGADRAVVGGDAALTEAARAVLAGPAGDYVRSHGGGIDLVAVHDGCVDVRLSGACTHCPAATATLSFRVERELRAAWPDLVALRHVS